MIILSTKHYNIEAVYLPGDSYQTWFLDRKIVQGKYIVLDNITNGTERHVRKAYQDAVNGVQKTFSNF